MRRLTRLVRHPVARRVALREEAVSTFEERLDEYAAGAAENVRMLALLEAELSALEDVVWPLVEAALGDEG